MLLSKNIHYLKGIHPGIYIDRLLKKSKISQRKLAEIIHVHHQTLNAIIKTKRNLNLKMALKIERYFNIEEGTLMLLQLFYEIEIENAKTQKTPNLDLLRPVLFWDTNMQQINWKKNKTAVIHRVFNRGNKTEQNEITRFYGEQEVSKVLKNKEHA